MSGRDDNDQERVVDLGGQRIRPDRFLSDDVEGVTFDEAEPDPEAVSDDELRELFHPDLVASAGIKPKS